MCDPVELRIMTASSFPTGTGSYAYRQRFEVIVRDIGGDQSVLICDENGEQAARRADQLHDGRERWRLETAVPVHRFSVKYNVAGVTFWDDNNGQGYHLSLVADGFAALLGHSYQIVLGAASLVDGWLTAVAGVRNLAYDKQVGLLYSTDDWASFRPGAGRYRSTHVTGTEVWTTRVDVGDADHVSFAMFVRAAGAEHWDNNFGADYRLARGMSIPVEG